MVNEKEKKQIEEIEVSSLFRINESADHYKVSKRREKKTIQREREK